MMMGSLRVIELQLVAFVMVFSATGLVPLVDLIFPLFTTAYIIALSRLAFPTRSPPISPETSSGGRLYEIATTTVGLFLPLAYVLGGFARGDDHAVRSATPHLFLLACQILTENIITGLCLFSPPVRALVPILYTARRIFVAVDWASDAWRHSSLPADAIFKEVAWCWFGRSVAVVNLVYFSLSLFGFLIPRLFPKALYRYLGEKDGEMSSKMAQDKSSSSRLLDNKTD